MKKLLSLSLVTMGAAACSSTPDSEVVYIQAPTHPAAFISQEQPVAQGVHAASLWTSAPNSLLSVSRATEIGDLLTVIVEMDDQASLQSSLQRNRTSGDEFNIDALFGLPDIADGVLPGANTLSPGIDFDRSSSLSGNGTVNRAEQIAFRLAARVVAVEPNGNLVIQGYQQTQVSNEVRFLSVSGVIRSQDITRSNTVTYDKIADARLSYVSNGEATGGTTTRAVPRLLDRVIPF